MMGPNFWKDLANQIGSKVKLAGAGLVKTASAALGEIEVVPMPDRIPLKEAEAAGFMRLAKPMGWGLYRAEDIDGGLGSIWSIEKAADGSQFLVKQVDPEGEVMRKSASTVYCSDPECGRVAHDKSGGKYFCPRHMPDKTASGDSRTHTVSECPGCGGTKAREDDYGELLCSNGDCERHRGHRPAKKAVSALLIERVAVAPPGEEKLVKSLKHDTSVDNPWAVAWSVHNKNNKNKKSEAAIVVSEDDLAKQAATK